MESRQPLLAVNNIESLNMPERRFTLWDHKEGSHIVWKINFALCQAFEGFGLYLREERLELLFLVPCVRALIYRNYETLVLAQNFAN